MARHNALDRANEVIARARARRSGVVTPGSAISPYDAEATQEIPRAAIAVPDPRPGGPDSTVALPHTGNQGGTQPSDQPGADFGPSQGWPR